MLCLWNLAVNSYHDHQRPVSLHSSRWTHFSFLHWSRFLFFSSVRAHCLQSAFEDSLAIGRCLHEVREIQLLEHVSWFSPLSQTGAGALVLSLNQPCSASWSVRRLSSCSTQLDLLCVLIRASYLESILNLDWSGGCLPAHVSQQSAETCVEKRLCFPFHWARSFGSDFWPSVAFAFISVYFCFLYLKTDS